MFFILRFFLKTRSRMPARTQDTHHFGSHGRICAQRYFDFADCDPFVPVSTFDNDSTTTSTVELGAAVPEASHRLPSFSIIPSVSNNLPLSICTQVRQLINFLVCSLKICFTKSSTCETQGMRLSSFNTSATFFMKAIFPRFFWPRA